MKKLLTVALMASLVVPLFAQEKEEKVEIPKSIPREQSTLWPSPFALSQWPYAIDVVGVRVTLPFSNCQESVTGFDIGFWGRSTYFEGLQFNVVRNDVKDSCAGIQAGLYNSVGRQDMLGAQFGLWNESNGMTGLQLGVINVVGEGEGFQIGIVNRAESFYGFQLGIVNVIRDSEVPFFPMMNIGF